MTGDRAVSELNVSAEVVDRLQEVSIRSVRQLYARLRSDAPQLQRYLGLSRPAFDNLVQDVQDIVSHDYPDDLQPMSHPPVHKQGVAVDRLNDPNRPRYR